MCPLDRRAFLAPFAATSAGRALPRDTEPEAFFYARNMTGAFFQEELER